MPNLSSPTLPGMPHKFWENITEMAYLPDVSQNPVYGGFWVNRQLQYLNTPFATRCPKKAKSGRNTHKTGAAGATAQLGLPGLLRRRK